jgi:hypothetical protein
LQEPQVSVNHKQENSWENRANETDAYMKHIEEEKCDVEMVRVKKELKHVAPYARKGSGPQGKACKQG